VFVRRSAVCGFFVLRLALTLRLRPGSIIMRTCAEKFIPESLNGPKWALAVVVQMESLKALRVDGRLLYSQCDCDEARRRLVGVSAALSRSLERRVVALEKTLWERTK
jgi:hypothetical protein